MEQQQMKQAVAGAALWTLLRPFHIDPRSLVGA